MIRTCFTTVLAIALLAGCSDSEHSAPDDRVTPVTVAAAETRTVERIERSVGRLRANSAPAVSAETGGRISGVHADVGDAVEAGDLLAEIDDERQQTAVASARAQLKRLDALLENERRRVRRLTGLAERQSIPQDQLDEAKTAVQSLEAQIDVGRARLDNAEYDLRHTRIVSPVSGRIQARLISEGDYVTPSMRVFELVSGRALRAFLPLPEALQGEVAVGQPVTLTVAADADSVVAAQVSDINPAIGAASSAMELIVDLDGRPGWRPGGSVSAGVVLARREGVVVPPISVVRRPVGEVVYVIDGDRVRQRRVTVGLRGSDWTEIVDGLEAGERLAVDGAGFLTDDARVRVQNDGDAP